MRLRTLSTTKKKAKEKEVRKNKSKQQHLLTLSPLLKFKQRMCETFRGSRKVIIFRNYRSAIAAKKKKKKKCGQKKKKKKKLFAGGKKKKKTHLCE